MNGTPTDGVRDRHKGHAEGAEEAETEPPAPPRLECAMNMRADWTDVGILVRHETLYGRLTPKLFS
jgi:hypothetical protein